MEKVAVYASYKTKDRDTIKVFLKQLANWCLFKNYDYTLYLDIVDNRISLKGRKELEDLKEDIGNKEYSKIVVRNISQLSRNTFENLDFFNFLIDNNCEIESMDGLDLELYRTILDKFNNNNNNKEDRER